MRRIHILIFSIVAIALVVLTIVLGTLNALQAHAALEDATYQQGQIAASSLREATGAIQAVLASVQQVPGVQENLDQSQMAVLMLRLADQNLYTFVEDNRNIQFASLLSTSGDVFLHSNPTLVGRPANEIGLQDVPVDRLSRRSVTGYGEMYVTRIHMTVGEPLNNAEFDIIVGMPTDPVDDAVQDSIITAILASLGVLFLVSLPAFLLIHLQVVLPLRTITADVQRLGAGQLDHRVAVRGSHEIRTLAHTVNQQAQRWQQARRELETLYHSAETRLVNRARDIEISAQIMHIATSLRDVDTLLRETVTQVRDRFDVIYHAQVFLLDDVREYAVLAASTGTAGEQLLALGHTLEVGSESLIGRVTSAGTTVIASDTQRGEVPWQPNPLLPSTRSEMALPLMIQGRVIGALDVQSIAPDVFTEDIMRTFEVLADQLAIAIENARLLAETQQRLAQINALNRRMTHAAWDEFVTVERRQKPQGYSYDLTQMSPLDADTPLPDDVPGAEVPIRVHGETVGTLMTTLPSSGRMTADDRLLVEAVADRVALAIENARLFEQTQHALTETERLYETARTISSASDLNAIYQMVVEQLSTSAHTDHLAILRSGPDPMLVQYLEEVFTWDHQQAAETPSATRIPVPPLTYTGADPLPIVAPVDYPDTQHDLPADHPLAVWLAEHNLRSVVLAPITAGGRWFGLLVIGTQDPGGFDAAYINFAGAMADQLALAIENRRLFEEAQIEARRARALAEAGQLASQIGVDLEAGLRSLFRAVSGPGNYDRWWFGLLSENHTTLQQVVAEGITATQTVNLEQDENALAEAARIGQIVLINDPHDHPLTAEQPPEIAAVWGKHIAMPVQIGNEIVGVLLIGRSLDEANLDERDIQLTATLASQIAVATENQNLFAEAESQRQRLQVIVDSMPTGILVMDRAGHVLLSNQNLMHLLGPEMRPGTPERPRPYPTVQADTKEDYPRNKWPLSRVFETGETASADDMTIIQPDGTEVNVLAQAAPIYDAQGNVTAVVGAFQDITNLQELEYALQDSLRETTLLYEASRSISRATTLEELLQATLWYMSTLQPDQAFIFLANKKDEHQPRGRLAASQPEMDLSDCHDNIFDGLFGDEPIIITRDTAPPETAACLDELGLMALSSFPLSVRGQISGWMMIGFRTAQKISTEQRRFMTTMADQAAVTIENQRLLLQTADALEETALLYHASRAVSDAETPLAVLDAFVHQASTHPVAYAALYILLGVSADTSFAAIELVAQLGTPAADTIGTRYSADQFALWDTIYNNEVVLINSLTADTILTAEAREEFVALGLQSLLIIPLRTGERLIGALVLGRNDQWADDEAEIRVYETLADQATVALENTRLLVESQRRARQLGTSAQISRAVTSILNLEELLPQVVNQIRAAFEYDHVQVFLISDDGKRAELVASTGEAGAKLLELKHHLPVGSRSVIGQVTETGEPQIALDTADARVVHRPNPILPHTRSEMALPLIARGQIVGALDVQSNTSGAFTDEDASILAALADMVATAIDNARLFEIAEQRAEEMAFLFSITTAAATSSDLDDALQQVVHTLRSTMNVSSASVYLPDESGETLVRGADVGTAQHHSTTANIDRGLIGWVARQKEPVVIGDLTQDPRRLTDAEQSGSVIAVPLVTGGELAGVMIVTSDELHAFDDDDVRLLQTLSSSLAAIIQNQRLLHEVQEANEQLLKVDRLKTNFLAAMSHELRTPLNSIIGFSRLLVKGMGGPLSDPQREDLTTIYESGKHLLGLVNDILDQAKLEAGKMELSHGVFKVQDVVKGVMSSAMGLTRDKELELYTEMAQDVPDAYGDEFRTRQVLLNLVSNAAKFTDEGSITVHVRPVVEHGRTFIRVSVTDTGIGIAEKDMHKLFEAFQQVDSSLTRKVGGTGMGLPLAKSFTELQGGRIWVDSEVGVGSTFHITIPTQSQSDGDVGVIDDDPDTSTPTVVEQVQPPKLTPAPPALTPNLDMESDGMPKTDTPPKTALIVEDNEGVMDLYRRCLEPLGYTIIGVTDPGAVRYTLAARPDVIVLDVHMRDGAGWGVLEDLVHRTTIPIVVCSIDMDRKRGLALGVAEYILKPFSEDQLANAALRAEAVAQRQRILLVDDQPETVRIFREALEATQRYRVFQVTSGAAALLLMQEPPHVDLVILDLRMPELDGFEVLQAMRADARMAKIPVLILTAGEVNESERVILQNIDMYRKDDIDEEHLLHQVQAQLNPNGEND